MNRERIVIRRVSIARLFSDFLFGREENHVEKT